MANTKETFEQTPLTTIDDDHRFALGKGLGASFFNATWGVLKGLLAATKVQIDALGVNAATLETKSRAEVVKEATDEIGRKLNLLSVGITDSDFSNQTLVEFATVIKAKLAIGQEIQEYITASYPNLQAALSIGNGIILFRNVANDDIQMYITTPVGGTAMQYRNLRLQGGAIVNDSGWINIHNDGNFGQAEINALNINAATLNGKADTDFLAIVQSSSIQGFTFYVDSTGNLVVNPNLNFNGDGVAAYLRDVIFNGKITLQGGTQPSVNTDGDIGDIMIKNRDILYKDVDGNWRSLQGALMFP